MTEKNSFKAWYFR